MTDLANRIRQARRMASLSQSRLAAGIGVNRSAVAQWERKGGSIPTTEHMIEIAMLCGVAFEWLATGRGPKWVGGGPDPQQEQALRLDYYAHDELEERLLLAFRDLPYRERIPFVEFLQAFAERPVHERHGHRVHEAGVEDDLADDSDPRSPR